MTRPNDDFEAFPRDLIAYLAGRLNLPQEEVVAQLGDLLVERLARVACVSGEYCEAGSASVTGIGP